MRAPRTATQQALSNISTMELCGSDKKLRNWISATRTGGRPAAAAKMAGGFGCLRPDIRHLSLGHLATGTLDRRTRDRAVRTEHAAVTRLGFETRAAAAAVIEEPASAGWHGLNGLMTAVRASDRGVQAHGRGNPITKMPVSGCYRVSAIIHAKAGTPIIPAEIAIAKRTVFATSQRNIRPPTKMLAGLP